MPAMQNVSKVFFFNFLLHIRVLRHRFSGGRTKNFCPKMIASYFFLTSKIRSRGSKMRKIQNFFFFKIFLFLMRYRLNNKLYIIWRRILPSFRKKNSQVLKMIFWYEKITSNMIFLKKKTLIYAETTPCTAV